MNKQEKPQKSEYADLIAETTKLTEKLYEQMEYTKDIANYANTEKKYHKRNWIATLLFIKGQVKNQLDMLKELNEKGSEDEFSEGVGKTER